MDQVTDKKTQNLPWVEKYRPQALDDLISHKDILSTINRFVKEGRLPHLLLYGPPGTGKTTTVLAVARQLYPKRSDFASMVLELNASDDRGIAVVREQILTFASTKNMFSTGIKIIVLDEADAMTKDAQNALRRIVEKYTENVRFCFICNYLSKIIPALQSRCTRFRFAPLTREQMAPRVQHVIDTEGLNVTDNGMAALVRLAFGDMRKALNILQSTSLAHNVISEDTVYTCVGHPMRKDIKAILNYMLNTSFDDAYTNIQELRIAKGLALEDILTEVHMLVERVEFPPHIKMRVVEKLAEVEHRLSIGTNEKIQTSAMISAFQIARDQLAKNME